MGLPRIVKIGLLIAGVYAIASHLFTSSGPENGAPDKDISFSVLSLERGENNTLLITIKNTGRVNILKDDLRVSTSGPCSPETPLKLAPGEVEAIRFRCPPGGVVRISAGKIYMVKRVVG